MKMFIFLMEIIEEVNGYFKIRITTDNKEENYTDISFNPDEKKLEFLNQDRVGEYLKQNEYQLRKILHNKRKDTFFVGFKVKIVLRDEKDVAAFNDRSKIVVLDKRNGQNDSFVVDDGEERIYKIYTDGSFMEKYNRGAYTVLIQDLKGNYDIYSEKTEIKSSSLIELMAAIKGLKVLNNVKKIRIITDSQYVRKGLTEWIVNWKLNDWNTANGEKAKNIEYWKEFDKITENKYIEFQWVKGHSGHFENSLCDIYAREQAKKETSHKF
ncbi:ribonuclease H family protein [Clostridium ganghwense]|uniref:ribonuclease H n=1 Tax=Clostridium ganghwense TaxID=312089 RepID=A0ABT4CLR1_9CLOT|nr:ribonuclease H [Clostridium ganghwense]MCY6369982.1 ribonuclease HI [Clostridium ganghwense]